LISIILIITLGLISSYSAPAPEYAFLELSLYLGLAFVSLSIAALVILDEKITYMVILWSLIAYAAIYEVSFWASYTAGLMIDGTINTRVIHSGFANIRFFNQYQIWSLSIICLPLLLQPTLPKLTKKLLFIIASLWITLLFATDSRGAFLSYILALFITALIFRFQSIPLLKINSKYLATGFVIYTILFTIPSLLLNTTGPASRKLLSTSSSSARLELWAQALSYIKESPWLGIGPMHYAYFPNKIAAHAHNSLLQIAAEFGLPVTILTILLFAWFLFRWVRDTSSETSESQSLDAKTSPILRIALFCSLISGLIYSQVSGVIVTPMGQTMPALILGVMIGLQLQRHNTGCSAPSMQQSKSLSVMIISGMIIISLTYLVTPQLTTRILSPFWGQFVPQHTVGPRFWRFGAIIQVPRVR